MIDWMRSRPVLAALAGLALLLAIVIVLEGVFGTRASDIGAASRPAASPDAKMLPPVLAQAPEQAFPEMTARPLFTPTRRPAPVEPSSGRASLVRGQFVLQGVIVVGDQRTALLKEKATGKLHRVDRGKDVNGVVVETIEPTEVTLAVGGERENVALVVQRPDGKAPAAAAPAADAGGPFAAPTAVAVPAAAPVAAAAPGQAMAPNAAPADRAVAGVNRPGPAPATPNAGNPLPSPTAQPMSPEELLARRRARRNQPTQ